MSDEETSKTSKTPSIADERRKISPKEAREAAAEASGFLASITITAGGEDFEVPQRGLLDDDQREAMDELEMESQTWDKEPDVEITRADGSTYKLPGNLKLPYQKDGKRIQPPYPVRVAIALWGEQKYERYKAAGGQATDVTGTLARLDQRMEAREAADPKSVGGDD
jgi:hypothetical protein